MIQVSNNPMGRLPALLPPRDAPYRLQGVYERLADGCRETLVLQWEEGYSLFRAEPNSDTLEMEFHETNFEPSPEFQPIGSAVPWAGFIGHEHGWSWLAINQQGYCDSVLLSFDGIIPSVMLHVFGSAIQFFTITSV